MSLGRDVLARTLAPSHFVLSGIYVVVLAHMFSLNSDDTNTLPTTCVRTGRPGAAPRAPRPAPRAPRPAPRAPRPAPRAPTAIIVFPSNDVPRKAQPRTA